MNQISKKMTMSRRSLLLGGITLLGSYVALSSLPSWAVPQEDAALQAQFMRLSNLLVNHRLDPAVGARILAVATQEHTGLPAMMSQLIGIAEARKAVVVEDFFGDIPEGPLQTLAHWIIFCWYTGSSSAKRDARVFTYEQALTYQTTADVVAIPSYGLSGPNRWSQVTVALADMPRF
ncbi:sugar dehydrogenase complex small subunit [Herbaspirillum sp. YR522]|uniref:sugar dehydrogenase complex small subunit n=1 Tax=Herbaspirillum sp. YR522 TaxID=1144342 RepID=UPI00026F7F95|nr:sugar dehydrogenase complex small subunit [Herbaspirillum sp. YR522]EJN03247.1 Membrane bound FAD containing D-sorbitol dehydrogenase [Herbaspirillum sp. YR522]